MECLECGDKIHGRSDKKFCSDGCRNTFNNNQNKDTSNLMRQIHNILRKNCRILDGINTEGKAKTTKTKLTSLGFDFNYITQIITYKNGATYHFIYDHGYKFLDEEWILLVKKSD